MLNYKYYHITTILHIRANMIVYVKEPQNDPVFDWNEIGAYLSKFY